MVGLSHQSAKRISIEEKTKGLNYFFLNLFFKAIKIIKFSEKELNLQLALS